MKSSAFQSLTKWAFSVCNADGNGQISRDDLYAGILLVHLHLAKYVGIAACQPLNRTQVDELYDIAATTKTGKIGMNEFQDIVVLSCARISSRVMIYWAVLVAMVPFLTTRTIALFRRLGSFVVPAAASPRLQQLSVWSTWLAEHAVSVAVFTAFVQWIYGKIDLYYAKKRKEAIEKRRYSAWDAFREKYLSLPQLDNNSDKGIDSAGGDLTSTRL